MPDSASQLQPNHGRNIEAFAVDREEKYIFAGNVLGQLLVIDIDRFEIIEERAQCSGLILAVETHPRLPYVAALGVDHSVSILRHDSSGRLTPLAQLRLRDIQAENGYEFSAHQSLSQALAFH